MSELLQSVPSGHLPTPTDVAFSRFHRFRKWLLIVTEYSLVQGCVQALGAIAGLLIVRSLPKSEYALFAIVNSMQTTSNLFADFGVGIGVRAIGGRVWNDPLRFGQLLATVIQLRRRFAVLSLSICLPLTAWLLFRNGANLLTLCALCLTLAIGLFPLLGVTAWATSAQLHGEYRRLQKLDLCNAVIRLALIAAFALSSLSARRELASGCCSQTMGKREGDSACGTKPRGSKGTAEPISKVVAERRIFLHSRTSHPLHSYRFR